MNYTAVKFADDKVKRFFLYFEVESFLRKARLFGICRIHISAGNALSLFPDTRHKYYDLSLFCQLPVAGSAGYRHRNVCNFHQFFHNIAVWAESADS